MATAGNITAVLTLNATGFQQGLDTSLSAVTKFKNSLTKDLNFSNVANNVLQLHDSLLRLVGSFNQLDGQIGSLKNIEKLSQVIARISKSMVQLSSDTLNAEKGINIINAIFEQWANTLNGVEIKVKGVTSAVREMSGASSSNSQRIAQMSQHQANLRNSYENSITTIMSFARALNRENSVMLMVTNAMKQYEVGATNVQQATARMNEEYARGNTLHLRTKEQLDQMTASLVKNSEAMQQNAVAKLRAMGYTGTLTAEQNALVRSSDKITSANTRATASTDKLTASTNRLKGAMSSLKMMGSLVGSMLAYNFAHKLLVATGETIHAKSEMEGYFKMLNFGQRDINEFNNELDKTVKQFQRVNKYALGETISSIGVEFNLSVAEMKKAMPVVSMITSEYLRAGRNVNEASLAVKDILQGEFQRLSRETGVKGKQLEEAGWSGDKTDVMGLLEALDKVGKSRNWDVFAEKANSLNDILTIIQNRFGEWSAEVVYAVQPSIVGAFNMILESGQKLASGLESVWKWLNGDGIENQVAKWGLLASAIGTVTTAFVVYRTGANLVQLAQMGLRGSIVATIFQLKAEEVATYGSKNALVSKITTLEAEKVAQLGVKNAILTKVLGLNSELVAQKGIKGSIMASTFARQLELASLRDASAEEMKSIYIHQQEQLAKMGTTRAIFAHIAGLNMELFAEKGVLVALAERIGISPVLLGMFGAETEAELSTAQAGFLLTASLTPLIALVGTLAIAFGSWAIALNNSAQQMGKFNELTQKGSDIIKENRKTVETYTKRQEKLKQKLAETEKGTAKYYRIQDQLRAVNQDLITSNNNLEQSIKAVERANSSQKKYNETMTDISIHQQQELELAYRKMGFTASESTELANESMRDANAGAEQLRLTLQKIQSSSDYTTRKMREFANQFDETNFTDKERIKDLTQDYLSARDLYMKGLEKSMTDDSFMGRLDGYFTMTQATILMDLDEWTIDWETGDLDELWRDIWNQAGQFLSTSFGTIPRLLGLDEYWKGFDITTILNPLYELFDNVNPLPEIINHIFGDWNWDVDVITNLSNWWDNSVVRPIQDWWNSWSGKTLSDFLGIDTDIDIIGMILDAIFPEPVSASDGSSDHPSFMDDVSAIIGTDVQQWIDNFTSDPLGTLGIQLPSFDIGGFISALFGGSGDDAQTDAENKGNQIGTGFSTGTEQGLSPVPDILNNAFDLTGVLDSFNINSQGLTTTATSTALDVATQYQSMKNNVKSHVDNLVSNTTNGFRDVFNKSHSSMTQMKDSTSQVTQQMTDAWKSMKDSIVQSAEKIKSDSEQRFKSLSDTIGGFYKKIQNPSSWAGSSSLHSGTPRPSVGRSVARTITGRGYAGSPPSGSMSIGALKQKLCPNGDCGNLFDGFKSTDVVDVGAFLSLVGGGHGFGGWNFSSTHKNFIKDKSNKWDTGSPVINLLGGIATSTKFKVGEFENGTPKISWEAFMSMAEAIFSSIPYKFYYDSSWKGSWLGALQAGACNCWDGAHALIAFANACGFGGDIVHGTWTDPDGTTYPHVWATINGKKMDTTAWQQRGSWSAGGSVSQVRSSRPSSSDEKPTIIVNINEPVYGVDDLDSKIVDSIDKGLQKHFNKSYTLGV